MSTIRIEADGTSDLARVYLWLTRHRGQLVELDPGRRLALGVPISGARAVIVAMVLQDDGRPGPQLGGVLRALWNPTGRDAVRLVFEGRSPDAMTSEEAEDVARQVIERISYQIAADDLVENVA